jgi:HK97 family phage major capsid protein
MLVDNAQRAVEQFHFPHENADRERSQAHIERLLHKFSDNGEQQQFARHLLATGSPAYRRAFGKAIAGQPLTTDEQRSLSLTAASGGYAVPVTLDPTIIPTSNGAVNPWRAISRVEQITGNTWNGVSAGAIVASRDAEFEEVSDDAPTLAQPTATVTKAEAFVPFSIEVGQDWGSLETEMARLIQDAKDVEEATAFATGGGTGVNPQGVLTGATGTVAAGTAAFAVAHGYALLEALPPRFRPNGKFVANLAQYNRIRQLDTAGGANIWVQNLTQGVGNEADGNVGATFLGKPAYESSVMTSALTAGSKIMIFGDFRYYLIVDKDRHDRRAGAAPVRGDQPAADRVAWPAGLLAQHGQGAERRGVQGARHHLAACRGRAPCARPRFCREPLESERTVGMADSKSKDQQDSPAPVNPSASQDPNLPDGPDLDPTKVVGTYAEQPDPNADKPAPGRTCLRA